MVSVFARRELGFDDGAIVTNFPDGAAVVSNGAGAVYRPGTDDDGLGAALLWARRHEVSDLHLLVDGRGGDQARRAVALGGAARVWRVVGAEATPVEPAPLEPEAGAPSGIDDLLDVIAGHGLEVVVEHGVVTAELLGLEVARIEYRSDGPRVDVGVGRFDREAGAILRGRDRFDDRLADALLEVGPHRRLEAEPHPVNRLCRERWLRAVAIEDPAKVGLAALGAVSPVRPRTSLRRAAVAPALGVDDDGAKVLVVCSAGVDLEMVPHAADLVGREGADRVVIAGLAQDQLAPIRTLAEHLPAPVVFVAMDRPWPV